MIAARPRADGHFQGCCSYLYAACSQGPSKPIVSPFFAFHVLIDSYWLGSRTPQLTNDGCILRIVPVRMHTAARVEGDWR
jgi:hypothetical protein